MEREGQHSLSSPVCFRLPASIYSDRKKIPWFNSPTLLPLVAMPVTKTEEVVVLQCLTNDQYSKLQIGINLVGAADRTIPPTVDKKTVRTYGADSWCQQCKETGGGHGELGSQS